MKQLWAPWRMTYLENGARKGDSCFLCSAFLGTDSVLVIERGEVTFTVLNRYPYSSGHAMVVPNRHVADVGHLTAEECGAMFAAVQRTVRAATKGLNPDGFNIGINQGAAGGASVDHVHMHVVPRWRGDTNFMPILSGTNVVAEELETTAKRLAGELRSL